MKIFQSCLILLIGLNLAMSRIICSDSISGQPIPADNSGNYGKNQQILTDSVLNTALNTALKQIKQFKHVLEYLALLVYGDSKQFPDKSKILDYIKKTRNELDQLDDVSFLVPEPAMIGLLQLINEELCKNLQTALDHNCWDKPFSLGNVIQRNQTNLPNFDETLARQEQNQGSLTKLNSNIERFGLTKIQKLIRSTEDLCQHAQFYIEQNKLEPYLKYGAVAAGVAAYLVYQSEYFSPNLTITKPEPSQKWSLWNNPVVQGFKRMIGSAPQYDLSPDGIANRDPIKADRNEKASWRLGANVFLDPKYTFPLANKDQLGIIGKTEAMLSDVLATETSPGILVPGAAVGLLNHKILGDNKLVILGLHLYPHPVAHMGAIVNDVLTITKLDTFKKFKEEIKDFFKEKYHVLRGKTNQTDLAQKPTLTFKDVIGLNHAKQVFEGVVDYIVDPEKFERTKLVPVKGYLMVGPPRTGKSHIAKAICGEINERQKLLGKPKTTSFISLDADLINDQSFYKLMEYINSKAPCVVFIDEIDLLCLNRGNGNKENKLLSQLLTHMSGYVDAAPGMDEANADKQVIFIAATNNPFSLDSALLQPGRFGKIISFEYPRTEERTIFIQQELAKRSVFDISDEFIREIAAELEGCSFDDLSQVITSAFQKASSEYAPISTAHFRAAIEENIKAILPDAPLTLSQKEISSIAAYQAGKALATKLISPKTSISTVTIKPINVKIEAQKDSKIITTPTLKYGGVFTYKNTDLLNLRDEIELRENCQILLAGHVAQELLNGSPCYAYRPEDQQEAFALAKQIALQGADYKDLTENMQNAILEQAYAIKKECLEAVRNKLATNTTLLAKINQQLIDKRCLGEREFNDLIA